MVPRFVLRPLSRRVQQHRRTRNKPTSKQFQYGLHPINRYVPSRWFEHDVLKLRQLHDRGERTTHRRTYTSQRSGYHTDRHLECASADRYRDRLPMSFLKDQVEAKSSG